MLALVVPEMTKPISSLVNLHFFGRQQSDLMMFVYITYNGISSMDNFVWSSLRISTKAMLYFQGPIIGLLPVVCVRRAFHIDIKAKVI